jgi:hypothetical protein
MIYSKLEKARETMMRSNPKTFQLLIAAAVVALLAACGGTPPVEEERNTLTVTVVGAGTVTSAPAGINVTTGEDPDTAEFNAGTEVALTATAASGSEFAGWSGACTGSGDCVVTMDDDASVTATFTEIVVEPEEYTLTVNVGSGTGAVTSTPAGIEIVAGDTTDSAVFLEDTMVSLVATPNVDESFAWGGACAGESSDTCAVELTSDLTVVVFFFGDADLVDATFEILAGSDDAEEHLDYINDAFPVGSVITSSSDLDLGFDTALNNGVPRGRIVVGLRYGSVTVPQGAIVTSATITFATLQSVGTLTLEFVAEASDDAATYAYGGVGNEASFGITGRDTTTESVTWVSDTAWDPTAETSPDISALVQAVVDREGWAAGQALAFQISSPDADVNNFRRAGSFENAAGAPVLSVTYFVPPAE